MIKQLIKIFILCVTATGINTVAESQWRQTGSTVFNFRTDGSWAFSYRDTVFYDKTGKLVVKKSSKAHTGWEKDSLSGFDSTCFIDGIQSENYHLHYTFDRDLYKSYSYLDSGKVLLIKTFWMNLDTDAWEERFKDSIVCSVPIDNVLPESTEIIYYPGFISHHYYHFNTADSLWVLQESTIKSEEESDTVTLVANHHDFYASGVLNFKIIVIFKSEKWSTSNLAEYRRQGELSPGFFQDRSKTVYTELGSKHYTWDVSDSNFLLYEEFFYLKDSYGNDTSIIIDLLDQTGMWESYNNTLYFHTYDENGNCIETIEKYDNHVDVKYSSKTVRTFTQIGPNAIAHKQLKSSQNLSFHITKSSISFKASRITCLKIFYLNGRMITAIKQPEAPSISINFLDIKSDLRSGTYLAQLSYANGKKAVPFVIKGQ